MHRILSWNQRPPWWSNLKRILFKNLVEKGNFYCEEIARLASLTEHHWTKTQWIFDNFTQWIFLLSPLCPHQNFLTRPSRSMQRPNDNLKQLIVYVCMAWTITLLNISLSTSNNSFSSQACNFFQTLSLIYSKLVLVLLLTRVGKSTYFS